MKNPTSVRKVTLMIVTVRNTSLGERGFMNASHLAKPQGSKSFKLENVSVPNADGARCERRRHPRRPKAKSAQGHKTGPFSDGGDQYYTDSSTDLYSSGPIADLEILPISPAPALGFSFPMSALLRIPN